MHTTSWRALPIHMRRIELITTAVLLPLDFCMVVLAALTAYSLRFNGAVATLRPVIAELPFRDFFAFTLGIGILWVLCMGVAGLYSFHGRIAIAEVGRIILASAAAMTAVIFFIFFSRELFSSRFIILAGWLLAIGYLTIARMIVRWVMHALKRRGIGLHGLLVVGEGEQADRIVTDLHEGRSEGFKLVGRLVDFGEDMQRGFLTLLEEKHPDAVMLATTHLPQEQVIALLNVAQTQQLDFFYVADLFATSAGKLSVQSLFGQPVVEVKRTRLDGWGRIWKRTFDFVTAAFTLIILSPIFLLLAVAIKLDSPGPIFARLVRVGERGRVFRLFKFRSMIRNAHALKATLMDKNERGDGPLFKMTNDPRITRIGRFIRRTSIDELPQLFNVLVGHMSIVGPRPHEPEEVSRYESWHRKLLTIKPGITGMAQVNGRASLNFDDEARLDISYIENWSFAMDLMIILRTPGAVLSRRAAV